MRAFTTGPAAARRRSGTGLLYLVISGLLWGTGGLTGSLLGRTTAACPRSPSPPPAHRRGRTDRRLPHGDRQALAGGPGGLDPDHRDRPAGRALSELLLHRRVADLRAAGHPGHHRRRPGHRARRGPGDRTADRPVRGRHHGPGRDRSRPARGPAVRLPRNGGAGQRGHGRARRGGLRRGHPGRLQAGARTRRPHRDRVRLHHRWPGPDAAGADRGRHRLPARPSRPSAC